ncbi:hypothetical protein C8Q79DRAFT_158581 [Trametes meyenii]|nr:hypothetical protein C8Q79DRAFT_158581 [Trametes meyenii]
MLLSIPPCAPSYTLNMLRINAPALSLAVQSHYKRCSSCQTLGVRIRCAPWPLSWRVESPLWSCPKTGGPTANDFRPHSPFLRVRTTGAPVLAVLRQRVDLATQQGPCPIHPVASWWPRGDSPCFRSSALARMSVSISMLASAPPPSPVIDCDPSKVATLNFAVSSNSFLSSTMDRTASRTIRCRSSCRRLGCARVLGLHPVTPASVIQGSSKPHHPVDTLAI